MLVSVISETEESPKFAVIGISRIRMIRSEDNILVVLNDDSSRFEL